MRVSNVSGKFILFFSLLIIPVFLFCKSLVFFSPQDNVSSKLIEHIKNTQQRICAAVYMLTDKKVANALIEASDRGVHVQLVTDESCLENEYGKIDLLKENGVEIFIFKSRGKKNKYSNELMHNKFALFDNKVWTGSYNWTVSANKKNLENVICTDDIDVYKKYEKQFEVLKRRCIKRGLVKTKRNTKKETRAEIVNKKIEEDLKTKVVRFLKSIRSRFRG